MFALTVGLAFGFIVLTFFALLAWDVLWTDIVGTNPHRPLSHALLMVPLFAVLMGFFFTFVLCLLALLALATITSVSVALCGRVLLWPLLVALPLFTVLIYLQFEMLPDFNWYTDHPDEVRLSPEMTALRITVLFLPAVLGTWWVLARRRPQ